MTIPLPGANMIILVNQIKFLKMSCTCTGPRQTQLHMSGPSRDLLQEMASRPQDYVSDHGRLTTNRNVPWPSTAVQGEEDGLVACTLHMQNKHGHLPQGIYVQSYYNTVLQAKVTME